VVKKKKRGKEIGPKSLSQLEKETVGYRGGGGLWGWFLGGGRDGGCPEKGEVKMKVKTKYMRIFHRKRNTCWGKKESKNEKKGRSKAAVVCSRKRGEF